MNQSLTAWAGGVLPELEAASTEQIKTIYQGQDWVSWHDPLKAPEKVLPYLAQELGVVWQQNQPILRRWLNSAKLLAKYAGTRWAIEQCFLVVQVEAELFEWFEPDPYQSLLNKTPIHFACVLPNQTTKPQIKYLKTMVKRYQPVRATAEFFVKTPASAARTPKPIIGEAGLQQC